MTTDAATDWRALLAAPPAPRGPLGTPAALDARCAAARAGFRRHLAALGGLERPTPTAAEPATFGAVIAAIWGPEDVVDAWRRWRGEGGPQEGALVQLERAVEDAQRQVSAVAASLDRLRREEVAVRAEIAALRQDVVGLAAAGAAAAARGQALERASLAIELAKVHAGPTEGAALDTDAAAVAAERGAAEDDARMYEGGARQLAAVADVGGEVLAWCARLRASLEAVHGDGAAALTELDLRLSQMAAEARAADLGAALAANLEGLRREVGRVHLSARDGADALMGRLDRLAEAPDLLAPVDPERRAAEAEVAALGRRG